MVHKRKDSDLPDVCDRHGGSSSTHFDHQLPHHHYHNHHHHHHHRNKNEPCCPMQVAVMFFIVFYLGGGFFVVLFSAASLVASGEMSPADVELMTFHHRTNLNPRTRADRFPSVEDRVKFYMSDWYLQPCSDEDKLGYSEVYNGNYTIIRVDVDAQSYDFYGSIQRNKPLYLDPSVLSTCTSSLFNLALRTVSFQKSQSHLVDDRRHHRPICADLEGLLPLKPSLAYFGGVGPSIPVPLFSSVRDVSLVPFASPESCRTKSSPKSDRNSPILWRMSSRRQFDMLVSSKLRDIPWEKKTPTAVFRDSGRLLDSRDECLEDLVCRFIIEHANSKLINAGYELDFRKPVPHTIDGIVVTRDPLGTRSLQSHKIIIDFNNGHHDNGVQLAWKLYSTSVLLMPIPTQATWLMEPLLMPWKHFIPLNDTNAEEMVQWL